MPLEVDILSLPPSVTEEPQEEPCSWLPRLMCCSAMCCTPERKRGRTIDGAPGDDGEEVWLHIYDFADSGFVRLANGLLLSALNTGAFHVGVEVYGWEWSFGQSSQGTGVFFCSPRTCSMRCYRESVKVGKTQLSPTSCDDVLRRMEAAWQGADYDLVRQNCCHFSEALIRAVVAEPKVPPWISSMHRTGARAQDRVGHAGRMAEAALLMMYANMEGQQGGTVRL